MNTKVKLHILFLIYSLTGIISKVISRYPFLSIQYCLGYVLIVGIMAGFTLAWQMILKKEQLSDVYMYKAMTIVWGNVFGVLIFHEQLSLSACVGVLFILAGIYFVGRTTENDEGGAV